MLYSFSKSPTITEFGGVPIRVAIPPEFAENAIPSITLMAKFLSFLVKPSSSVMSKAMTEEAMGSITTVVAVLLIHILRRAVANIKPKMTRLGEVPVRCMMVSAILRCKFTFSSAKAITNPPKNRKTIELP